VHEVPCLQRSLFALDDEQALAREDEEVLLRVLGVVHGARLARSQDTDADPDLGEARLLGVEHREVIATVAVEPACVADVHDEPPFGDGFQAMVGALGSGLRNHRL
jgi:hypothetical protein